MEEPKTTPSRQRRRNVPLRKMPVSASPAVAVVVTISVSNVPKLPFVRMHTRRKRANLTICSLILKK
jgi:hypothetical protein